MKIFITILLISFFSTFCKAQVIDDFAYLTEEVKTTSNPYLQTAKKNKNEIELMFSVLFSFYKNYISSQDLQKCSFTPSCSEYAFIAVRKKGVFIGMLSGFDRLTRCHSLSKKQYPIDHTTHLLYDPVE